MHRFLFVLSLAKNRIERIYIHSYCEILGLNLVILVVFICLVSNFDEAKYRDYSKFITRQKL